MNVIVLGGGAIGTFYAAKLSARHDVTLVGRAAHVDAIRTQGLRITGLDDAVVNVKAGTAVDDIRPDTLILVTVKAFDTEAAVTSIEARLRSDSVILCVQNGLDTEAVARRVVAGRALVLRAVTYFGLIFVGPGVISLKAQGHTSIERSPESQRIADTLSTCGLDSRVSADIAREVWTKTVFNCVVNPLTAMTGLEVGRVADSTFDPLKRLVIEECVAVARHEGIELGGHLLPTLNETFRPSTNLSSMHQDLMKGKRTEIEYLNGAVVRRGRAAGIPCPVNEALTAIITAMQRAPFKSAAQNTGVST
jgi:2-dehydropantoate 2-reductase